MIDSLNLVQSTRGDRQAYVGQWILLSWVLGEREIDSLTLLRRLWENNRVRGRAGSTGAFRSGLQAEDAISLVNPVAKTIGEREFALAA